MNSKELAQYLNTTERSIEKELPRLKKQLLNKGQLLIKEGRGKSANYTIKDIPTIYSINKSVYLNDEIIKLSDFAMLVSLAFTIEPNTLIHSSYIEFCNFLELEPNKKNINIIKQTLHYLDSIGLITYKVDTSNKDWFVGIWSIVTKNKYKIELKIINQLKNIIIKEKKSNKYIMLLLKTLVGIKSINEAIITKKDFCKKFNISLYQFDECIKILTKANIINKEIIKIEYDEGLYPIGTQYRYNALTDISYLISLKDLQ